MRTKLCSWLIGVITLGFLYAGEALAICCKNPSTGACKCVLGTSCTLAGTGFTTTVSSCSVSGGTTTFRGSVIACSYNGTQGTQPATVSADPGSSTQPAKWTEQSPLVTCDKFPDANGDGVPDNTNPVDPGLFSLKLEYTFPSTQAACTPNGTGSTRSYNASCGDPGLAVAGTLTFVYTPAEPSPPTWIPLLDPKNCLKDELGRCIYQMELGEFRLTNKGTVDLAACATDFPAQSGGLGLTQVLRYNESYQLPNCTGQVLSAGPAERRMCTNNSFDPASKNGPCDKIQGQTVTTGGIDPDDQAEVSAMLYDDQFRPRDPLNVNCSVLNPGKSEGNVPATFTSSESLDVRTIVAPDSVFAFVKGFPEDRSPALRLQTLSDKTLTVGFDACRGDLKGLNNIICKHQSAWAQDGSVELAVTGTALNHEFVGFTSRVVLQGTCAVGTF